MSSTQGIVVSAALWEALSPQLQQPSSPHAAATVVLAAYLDLASQQHGLSEHYETEVDDRLNAPASLLPLIRHYLGIKGPHVDPDDVRAVLYASLLRGVDFASHTRSAALRDMWSAQVYWALSDGDGSRERLPYRSGHPIGGGELAQIWEPDLKIDLASLARTPRTDVVKGNQRTSGSALRKQGAKLAVRAASELVSASPRFTGDGGGIDIEVIANAEKRFVRAVGSISTAPPAVEKRDDSSRAPTASSAIQGLDNNARDYEANGLHFLAGTARSLMVQALSEYSATNPVDNEDAIAAVAISAGFSYMEADRPDLAISEFDRAIRIDEVMSVLGSDAAAAVRLTAARATVAVIKIATSQYDEARQSLDDSLNTAQSLADDDHAHEGLLALILLLKGSLEMQLGELSRARLALERATKIARKIIRREAQSVDAAQLASTSLMMQGALNILEHRLPAAQACLAEAIASSTFLSRDAIANRTSNLAVAGLNTMLGTACAEAGRSAEARDAWLAALSAVERIEGDDLAGRGASLIRQQSLLNLAVAALDEDDTLARDYAARAVADGRRFNAIQLLNEQALSLFGKSLMVLGMAAYALEDDSVALASLRECIMELGRAKGPGANELLLMAQELLNDVLEDRESIERRPSAGDSDVEATRTEDKER